MVDLVPNIVLNTHHNRRVNIFCPSVIRLVCRRCSIIISFCTLCLAMTMTEGWARDTGTGRARVLGRVVQWLGMRGGGGLSLPGLGRLRTGSGELVSRSAVVGGERTKQNWLNVVSSSGRVEATKCECGCRGVLPVQGRSRNGTCRSAAVASRQAHGAAVVQ